MILTKRDLARADGYSQIIALTQDEFLTVHEIKTKLKSITPPTIIRYCDYLVEKGYMIERIERRGTYKVRTRFFKAKIKEYDINEITPMVVKGRKKGDYDYFHEVIPEPIKGGKIISFHRDENLRKLVLAQEKANRQTKRYSSNDGYREAAC